MRLSDEQKIANTPDEQTIKVLDYLKKENEYSKALMKHTEVLQKILYDEISGRIKKDDESVPYLKNGYYYYNRFKEGSEYPVYYRKKGSLDSPEEILLDVNKLAEGKDYCSVNNLSISRDNKLLIYGVDYVGRRQYTLVFVEIESGSFLPDKIENTSGQAIWAADNSTVFYVKKDVETLRDNKVFKHKIGSSSYKDVQIFNEEDETFDVYLSETKSRKYILINSTQTLSSEIRYLDVSRPDDDFKVFQPRSKNHEYNIDHLGKEFLHKNECRQCIKF
jgi:oligopeptidase B